MEDSQPEIEFSRLVPLGELARPEIDMDLEATAEERAALAKRLGLLGLDRLTATVRLRRKAGSQTILVTGRLVADVVQSCVVTLEPVPARVEEPLRLSYTLAAARRQRDDAVPEMVVVEPEGDDPPDPVGPAGIELGEAVVQQLSLALDPYPRAPGAALDRRDWVADGGAEEGEDEGPFGVLKALRPEAKDR